MTDSAPSAPGGLTSAEARARLARFGPNRLVARERAGWLVDLGGLLLDPMALMLLAAAAIYIALGERRDAAVMLVALVPVLGVDVFLEARSRSALKKLSQSVAPRARVLRDGRELSVDTAELVPGDLLLLAEGEFVHADGVIRAAANLAIDESSLTGESEPQRKRSVLSAALAEAPADARFYAGSVVLAGHGRGEIAATGRSTRFGEIARLVAEADTSATPLQRRVGRLVQRLAVVATAVAVAVIGLGRLRGSTWGQALLGGISVAMSAAPEEFPLVFTLFLSVGAWRLTRQGVLVRRLASVETLGSTTVICTDKTGTLTRGEFVLDALVPLNGASERTLLEAALLACEVPPSDPIEKAIALRASASGVAMDQLGAGWRLVRDHDFDPIGKHMSHVWASPDGGGRIWIAAKGALEGILEHAQVSASERKAIEEAHVRLASQGSRVLAVAARLGSSEHGTTRQDDERELSFLGLLGFRDPMRPEVPGAVRECRAAGVRIKVVTGDHALTAHAVAQSAGIVDGGGAIVTGDELERAPDDERRRLIAQAAILSRITPAQKYMIVEALRAAGEVVAMTGDGINDAPALRRADIGVSMGRRGTDVARAAADLVLLDDDFASIVAAVREGRKIFLEIQRAFLYLLAFHVPIVGLALTPPLLGMPLLLMPVHFVWLELIVHPVSALLFQGDPPPADLMRRPPRAPRAPMLPSRAVLRSVLSGALLTIAAFAVYAWRLPLEVDRARGVALATLILGYQLLVLVERATSAYGPGVLLPRSLRAWLVWGASGVSLPLLMYVPATAALVKVAPLGAGDWTIAAIAAGLAVGWRALAGLARRR
ncbi:MAG TPA: cation-transporting P-type ATPase [Myxococcota bacterium]|nr:cation-transporting P-type ATPase [Myxococcota bacterium]